jgi:hypothetical protein
MGPPAFEIADSMFGELKNGWFSDRTLKHLIEMVKYLG